MKTSPRLARTLDRVTPKTRRGRILAAAGLFGGAAILAAALVFVAGMAWNPYLQFSLDHSVNVQQWATRELSFTSSSTCRECHAPEQARLVTASHAGIGCQSCHGALAEHAEAGDKAASDQVAVRVPTNEVCIRCHYAATGRPAGLREIIPTEHYINECLQCHDPHTGIANRPPVVSHPLENLPRCLTCHGPEGFKSRNIRHPEDTGDDRQCLQCHAAGRGPSEDEDAEAVVTP